jgi:hypothetical protein
MPPSGEPPPQGAFGSGGTVTVNEWENSSGLDGFVEAVRQILFEPYRFFEGVDMARPMGRAILLALICYTIGGVAQAIWNGVFSGVSIAMDLDFFGTQGVSREQKIIELVVSTIFYLASPILSIIGAYMGGAILHLFLVLFGCGESRYPATVRALLYSAAPSIFMLFPCCGNFVAAIWSIVVSIIGLSALHKAQALPVIGAYLCTLVFCCCCVVLAVCGVAAAFGIGLGALMSQFPYDGRI